MRKWDKNSPRTSTCEDILASTIAISGVRCYTVVLNIIENSIGLVRDTDKPEIIILENFNLDMNKIFSS